MSETSSHLFGDFSERFAFRDWPNEAVPKVTAGVDAIWNDDLLVYCGMSGRGFEKKSNRTPKNLDWSQGFVLTLRVAFLETNFVFMWQTDWSFQI